MTPEAIALIKELREIIRLQTERISQLEEEIRRLKGLKGKPKIKPPSPSSKPILPDPATEATKPEKKTVTPLPISIDRTEIITIDKTELPADAIFKGYSESVKQEIEIKRANICFKLEQYYSPSENKTYQAQVPKAYRDSAFGPQLHSLVMCLCWQLRVTENLIQQFFQNFGIDLSEGSVSNILIQNIDHFHQEKTEVFQAGLTHSQYHHVDDAGARHQGRNYYTTVLTSEWYTAYFTKATKSRLSFLEILNGDQPLQYCWDELAISLASTDSLQKWIEKHTPEIAPQTFHSKENFLEAITYNYTLTINEQQQRHLLEIAAISYYLQRDNYPVIKYLVRDDAGQFHLPFVTDALCWIHADRSIKRLPALLPEEQMAIYIVRYAFWKTYRQLKDFKTNQTPELRSAIAYQFDQLTQIKSGYAALDKELSKLAKKRSELLISLDHPILPLHNNPAELEIRRMVIKRKISYGTKSEAGRKARDSLMSLLGTCQKLSIRFWDYLLDRNQNTDEVPRLADLINRQSHVQTA